MPQFPEDLFLRNTFHKYWHYFYAPSPPYAVQICHGYGTGSLQQFPSRSKMLTFMLRILHSLDHFTPCDQYLFHWAQARNCSPLFEAINRRRLYHQQCIPKGAIPRSSPCQLTLIWRSRCFGREIQSTRVSIAGDRECEWAASKTLSFINCLCICPDEFVRFQFLPESTQWGLKAFTEVAVPR